MADVEQVEVVVAHNERATLRVGDVFVKIDADQTRTDVEVKAMALAPIPTPEVAAVRMLHDAPPPWPGRSLDELAADLDRECELLVTNGVLPADLGVVDWSEAGTASTRPRQAPRSTC